MEAKELMIGDLVHLYVNNEGITNEDVKVVELSEDSITILNKFGIDEEYSEDDAIDGVSAITPIFLTPEILEANGFKYKEKDNEWWHYDEFPFSDFQIGYEDEDDKRVIFNIDTTNIKVNYVHQLQHALRLCGINELADNLKIE